VLELATLWSDLFQVKNSVGKISVPLGRYGMLYKACKADYSVGNKLP